jgi:hypothetical protein
LGSCGVLERLFREADFVDFEEQTIAVPLRMASADEALTMMREACGANRAVVADCPEAVRSAAWTEVAGELESFKPRRDSTAGAEVVVAAGRSLIDCDMCVFGCGEQRHPAVDIKSGKNKGRRHADPCCSSRGARRWLLPSHRLRGREEK